MDIKLEHLDFCFGEHRVFADFSMEVPGGTTLCLMGESGCGKTTLLRLLSGLLAPCSGKITGAGEQRISMVFQEDRLCGDFSAKVNVRLGCCRGCYPNHTPVSESRVLAHLDAVGLSDAADRRVSELSGGMKRRVAIVRAVLSDSDLLLMDEPFTGLDAATRQQVIRYVLQEKGKRTLLAVTHNAEEAAALGGAILHLSPPAL